MLRHAFACLAWLTLPGIVAAQPAPTPPWLGSGPPRTQAERAERHWWMEQNWDALTPEQRQQAEERFRRGMGPQGPGAEEMQRRWQSMTPGQRRELMMGHHRFGRGPHGPGRDAPRRGPG